MAKLEVGSTYVDEKGNEVSITETVNYNELYRYKGDNGQYYNLWGDPLDNTQKRLLRLKDDPTPGTLPPINLEVGKTYINQKGIEVSITEIFTGNQVYRFKGDNGQYYSEDGRSQFVAIAWLVSEKDLESPTDLPLRDPALAAQLVDKFTPDETIGIMDLETDHVDPVSEFPAPGDWVYGLPTDTAKILLAEDCMAKELEIIIPDNIPLRSITFRRHGSTHTITFPN